MAWITTIDGAGRLVVPKAARKHLGLRGGSTVTIAEEGDHLVVRAGEGGLQLREEGGLLVVVAGPDAASVDHRELREERLRKLGGR